MAISIEETSQIFQALRNFGFSSNEARIYITTWEIGSNPASTIARITKINRSSCYLTLQKLTQKGFIHKINKNNITYFYAINPKHILDDIVIKINNFQRNIDQLQKKPPIQEGFFNSI